MNSGTRINPKQYKRKIREPAYSGKSVHASYNILDIEWQNNFM
ncbi:hypothetical protein [Methanosarcina horonobensis]|nr:hypothetical protein [Methanosarcina horonobensis]